MENKKVTLKEILVDAVQTLNNLPVPVAFVNSISVPLRRVAGNLQACIDTFAKNEKEEAEKGGVDDGAE